MNIYEYNSSSINEYLEEDFGSITSSPSENFDCQKLSNNFETVDNYGNITCNETLIPFGSIRIDSSKEKTTYKKVSSEAKKFEDINKKSIILHGIVFRWIGFNFIFESNSTLVRQVIPDVSGGGRK
jgi:hypothetical protein